MFPLAFAVHADPNGFFALNTVNISLGSELTSKIAVHNLRCSVGLYCLFNGSYDKVGLHCITHCPPDD